MVYIFGSNRSKYIYIHTYLRKRMVSTYPTTNLCRVLFPVEEKIYVTIKNETILQMQNM